MFCQRLPPERIFVHVCAKALVITRRSTVTAKFHAAGSDEATKSGPKRRVGAVTIFAVSKKLRLLTCFPTERSFVHDCAKTLVIMRRNTVSAKFHPTESDQATKSGPKRRIRVVTILPVRKTLRFAFVLQPDALLRVTACVRTSVLTRRNTVSSKFHAAGSDQETKSGPKQRVRGVTTSPVRKWLRFAYAYQPNSSD